MSSDTVRSKQPRDFDPVSFTVVAPRRFEDPRIGEVFRAPSRTLTDAHAASFQTVSVTNPPSRAAEKQKVVGCALHAINRQLLT